MRGTVCRLEPVARCLIPRFDGVILSLEWKEAVWARYVMGAPRPRAPSEQQYSDRKVSVRPDACCWRGPAARGGDSWECPFALRKESADGAHGGHHPG